MTEPTSAAPGVGLLGLLVMLAGPVAGPYVYVLFGAVLGAFTALSARKSGETIMRDGAFLVRVAATALLFTAPLVHLIVGYVQLPVEFLTGIAAYVIGWRWDAISRLAWGRIRAKLLGSKEGGDDA